MADPAAKKKKVTASAAWREARELVWTHRRRLAIGLALMLISRGTSFVLPLSSKWLFDEVATKGRAELLPTPVRPHELARFAPRRRGGDLLLLRRWIGHGRMDNTPGALTGSPPAKAQMTRHAIITMLL